MPRRRAPGLTFQGVTGGTAGPAPGGSPGGDGSAVRAASPTTSSSEPAREHTTGVPDALASSGGGGNIDLDQVVKQNVHDQIDALKQVVDDNTK